MPTKAMFVRMHNEEVEELVRLRALNTELLAALNAMLTSYAPGADWAAAAEGEDRLHSSVRAARAVIAAAASGVKRSKRP